MRKELAVWLKHKVEVDDPAVKEMKAFDDMVNMKWELPPGLSRLNYAVKYVDPIAHDAEKTATNFFDTYQPKIDILPRGPEDKDTAEELERFVEWHMMRANLHGDIEPFRRILQHAVRYNRVCVQLDYLPYWLPKDKSKWTDEQREAMADSPFCVYVHDPKNVHYDMGPYGLRKIATTSIVLAADVINHWGVYPKANLDEVKQWAERDPLTMVMLVDYTDHKRREVSCWKVSGMYPIQSYPATMEIFDAYGGTRADVVDIMNEPNKLGFINWVVATGSSDALFAALHRGDLWVNANRTESIKRSDLYRRAFYPLAIEEGLGTEDVEVDFSGDQVHYKVPAGKKLTPINRPPIDPAWAQLSAEDRAIMSRSTSVETLAAVEPKSNVQFATINAFIQLSLTNLAPYVRTAEKSIVGLCRLVFKWLKVTGSTEVGRRAYSRGEAKPAGMKIVVGPDDFDTESLFITCKLIEDTPTGKLQLANMIAQLRQAGMPIPSDEFLERLGYGHPDALRERWEKEQMRQLALTQFAQQKQMEMQMQAQQVQMEQQMAAQQANRVQQPMMPGGQGNNPAAGGMPPAASAPELTQTQLPPSMGMPQ